MQTSPVHDHHALPDATPLSPLRTLIAWGAYPVVMVLGTAFALWMSGNAPAPAAAPVMLLGEGIGLSVPADVLHRYAMYGLPVLFAAIAVMLMERFQPFSLQWRPDWKENVGSDVGLFLLNNIVLRADLIVAVLMAMAAAWAAERWGTGWWPAHWPLVLQVLLFLLLAELMTYWLHRLQHEHFLLWRMHCVHHNPHRLYWLNATRFHFFDIVAIPLLGNLPAVLLGADMHVIYLGTMMSVMHGFWQHCNAEVRFGWLNYVVSSPELHRWHHVRDVETANHNYGSNLIVWDLVFRTWLLPARRLQASDVGATGLAPAGVLQQLWMPFVIRADQPDKRADGKAP